MDKINLKTYPSKNKNKNIPKNIIPNSEKNPNEGRCNRNFNLHFLYFFAKECHLKI